MVAPTIFKERYPDDVEAMRIEVERENISAGVGEYDETMEFEPP